MRRKSLVIKYRSTHRQRIAGAESCTIAIPHAFGRPR